jgi:DNA-binding FadR family transcriptional regulator
VALQEHTRIVDAISARLPDEAGLAMAIHLKMAIRQFGSATKESQ